MPNESNKCNGLVIGHAFGKIAMVLYVHEDGLECSRPGDVSWPVGSFIESTFERIRIDEHRTLCEHTVIQVHHALIDEPEEKPPLTVADIIRTRSSVPDDMPSKELIEKAKIPPKIRRDPSTIPARDITNVPVESRYEYDLTDEELREINAVRHIPDEPISTGKPTSPFSGGFNPRHTQQPSSGAKRRPREPVSAFDQ